MGPAEKDAPPSDMTHVYLHSVDENPCGGVAFYHVGVPEHGEPVTAKNAWVGRVPEEGEPICCMTCGAVLPSPLRLSALIPRYDHG